MGFTTSLVLTLLACLTVLVSEHLHERSSKTGQVADGHWASWWRRPLDGVVIFLVTLTITYLFNSHKFVPFNSYSYLAQSLLDGRLDIPNLPTFYEHIKVNGKIYLQVPPGAVIFVLPFVALLGTGFNIGPLSLLLGAANTALFHELLKRFGFTDHRPRLWLTALFGFGTVHFYLSAVGYSWFLAQLGGTFFLFLAMLLTMGGQKIPARDRFLAGLFFGLAVTCRLSLLLTGIFFATLILRAGGPRWRPILVFLAGAFIPGALYMFYNFSRFGSVLDLGYLLFYRLDSSVGGPTDPRYIPFNLYSLFIMAPEWTGRFPYIEPLAMQGVSLTFTTPALYYAVKAKGPRWLIALLWSTVFLAALPFLMNCGNGYPQFGMRYALDFIPFLLILTAYAIKEMTFMNKAVIMFCIFVNAWGVLHWNFFRWN